MKKNMIEKKKYSSPIIETITLDCDISLAMESVVDPPNPTNENPPSSGMLIMHNDPYKNQFG